MEHDVARLALIQRLKQLSRQAGGPLLGLDTSGAVTSLVLVTPSADDLFERSLPAASLPSESLVQGIAEMLSAASLSGPSLRGIVVGIGPGSFTGLRVGLATAKGLAMAAQVPLYPVSSLAVLAASAGPGYVAPILDARRGEVFAACYQVDESGLAHVCLADAAVPAENFVRDLRGLHSGLVTYVGEALGQCLAFDTLPTTSSQVNPRMAFGLLYAGADIVAARHVPAAALVPQYLRVSEAERRLPS